MGVYSYQKVRKGYIKMTTGYQIYKFNPERDECFVEAGLINWFPTLEGAKIRKAALEETWSKYGTQYMIVKCHE